MNNITKLLLIAIATITMTGATASLKTTKSAKEADVVLSSKNTVSLRGPVTDETVSELIRKLRELDNKNTKDPINLVLYTPGGSITAGLELIDVISGLRRPVRTVTLFAASMGFQIVQSLDERLITKNGTLMSHKARGGLEGEFSPNSDSQMDKRLNFWKSMLLQLDQKTVERTEGKQTLKSYQDAYENELWLNGTSAVAGGYADKVVTVRCDESLSGTEDKDFQFLGMTVVVKFSKCPLQSAPESVTTQIKTNMGNMTMEEFGAKGGILGIDCIIASSRLARAGEPVLCAVDGSLTKERVIEERKKVERGLQIDNMKHNIGYTQ